MIDDRRPAKLKSAEFCSKNAKDPTPTCSQVACACGYGPHNWPKQAVFRSCNHSLVRGAAPWSRGVDRVNISKHLAEIS